MTEREFLSLDYDVVVEPRGSNGEEYYVIYDTDQMGSAYRGKLYAVYGAERLDGQRVIRIDKSNYQFWNVIGKMNRKL